MKKYWRFFCYFLFLVDNIFVARYNIIKWLQKLIFVKNIIYLVTKMIITKGDGNIIMKKIKYF